MSQWTIKRMKKDTAKVLTPWLAKMTIAVSKRSTIDLVERGLDRKNAQLLLGAAKGMKDRKFAMHIRVGLAGAGGDHHGVGVIGGLAHFDETDVRQVKNPVDLQLELARVKVPEPFAEAATIATLDLGYPAIDRADVTAILEVELQRVSSRVIAELNRRTRARSRHPRRLWKRLRERHVVLIGASVWDPSSDPPSALLASVA